MSVGAIIVAAGRGARLGGPTPKQLLDLGGRTILQRSVAAFDGHAGISEIVVVLPGEWVADGATLVGKTARPCHFAAGGERRQDSVARGLAAMPAGPDLILVHDAARPFAGRDLIDRVIAAAAEHGAAVPAIPARDTVKRLDLERRTVRETIAREEHLARADAARISPSRAGRGRGGRCDGRHRRGVAGRARWARRARRRRRRAEHEDHDARRSGIARARGCRRPHRVGTGYDLHRLVEGRPLCLAGVVVPFERGPLGHSDGDVLCHAITDAVLGAAAAGDIGQHFSNTDPRWKDSPGLELLQLAVGIVRERGFQITGVDATVILERPKIAPFLPAIRAHLARVLGCELDGVSVKGKTNEGVDAVGRGEAIAAHAVAVLRPGEGR